ncbi:ATP-binding protein [Actinomadura bangladeshensis]|uniref:ATP-binding protein n=1 Tax=Actinomadura bangladeshensis TaxID=453573 RepID=A0A6L9QCE4_9ACTN|nr:ATP-binding protein [Actinomadura bangladeshensis]
MNTWTHQSGLTLIALPNAAYWARRHTEEVLKRWDACVVLGDAKLVITEFISNAVRATGTLDVRQQEAYARAPLTVRFTELSQLAWVRLRLSYGRAMLLVEVWDSSDEPPVEQLPDFESEGGRGLFVVRAYCDKWGWYPTQGGGKVVWAELSAS